MSEKIVNACVLFILVVMVLLIVACPTLLLLWVGGVVPWWAFALSVCPAIMSAGLFAALWFFRDFSLF